MSGGQIIIQLGLVFNKLSMLSVLIYAYGNKKDVRYCSV